jgi:hypothetical protein
MDNNLLAAGIIAVMVIGVFLGIIVFLEMKGE